MQLFRHLPALLTVVAFASVAEAQSAAAPDTPLHLAANRFQFVVSGDTLPSAQPLRIHNGGTAQFTNVHLTRLVYADSARGSAWLVAVPRQTSVAPDELAAVASLCVDPAGLPAGTYRATAAVAAREVPEPVAFTITLVVTDAATRGPARCGIAVSK